MSSQCYNLRSVTFGEFIAKKGIKVSGLSPETQTNLNSHNYICIYIRTLKV